MSITNEEILANAPEGATHYGEGVYFKANAVGRKFLEYSSWNGKGKPEWWLNRVSSEMQSLSDIRRIVELESELDKAYNDLANFEGYPEEVSALRHDIERRKQRYLNLLNKRKEWKKRAESVERELDDSQRKLSALSYCIKNQISSFYDARSYEEAVNAALVELNKFAIEQQIKAVEYCYKNIPDLADSDYVKLKRRAEQLRQQLNGGE